MPKIDVFKQYIDAEWAFLNNQSETLYKIFRKIRLKAMKTFKEAKTVDGGKEIRLPMNYAKGGGRG